LTQKTGEDFGVSERGKRKKKEEVTNVKLSIKRKAEGL